ncbi:hypothetical protein [Gloeobacter violaceus]|uniref:hypothetical protein n=1 Tax=Gloeobacter violaceus TaxID=33072 RepID=UPI0013E8A8B6|nr:hypothetical protein [Gloeobacter violaceus]
MKYKDWTITTQRANVGFLAILVDPDGKELDEPYICLPSPESAEYYAQRLINWYITLEQQRRTVKRSVPTTTRLLNTRLSPSGRLQLSNRVMGTT